MDRERFVEEGRGRWEALEARLGPTTPRTGAAWSELAAQYRSVCADLSRAQTERVDDGLLRYLDDLAARAHDRLYAAPPRATADVVHFLTVEVPREVRASAVWFGIAAALFYGTMLLALLVSMQSGELAGELVDLDTLRSYEEMYTGAIDDRSTPEALGMLGFYVYNNVSIAFRCFATGVLGGLGAAFFLVYNGTVIGTVFGHLIREGHGANLFAFVASHSAWELTGIVVAGAGGLKMGWALIDTGGLTRRASLRAVSPSLFRLAVCSAVMIVVAAAVEGLLSASPVPVAGKVAFGAVQAVALVLWLGFGGRRP